MNGRGSMAHGNEASDALTASQRWGGQAQARLLRLDKDSDHREVLAGGSGLVAGQQW